MKFLEKLKEKGNLKFVVGVVAALLIGIGIGNSSAPTCSVENHNGVENKIKSLNKTVSEKDSEIESLNLKLSQAQPWFEKSAQEQKAIEEENARIKAEEEAKKKAEEEEKKRLAEEEEKKGYDTGISYGQLARTPDDYKGKKVKFSGKVIQVMEGDGEVQIRLAVGGDYDTVIYGAYSSDLVSSRVLEDDYITVMGLSSGLLTYKSTMGGEITIPSMLIQKIDQ